MEKYRFDDAYKTVYEYDDDSNAYIFCGRYIAFGISSNMTESEKIRRVNDGLDSGVV